MNEFVKIKDIDHLKSIFDDKENEGCCAEFFIQLPLGRSWKTISFDGEDKFFVLNQIDESEQELTSEELFDITKSSIGASIKQGTFYFAWF